MWHECLSESSDQIELADLTLDVLAESVFDAEFVIDHEICDSVVSVADPLEQHIGLGVHPLDDHVLPVHECLAELEGIILR